MTLPLQKEPGAKEDSEKLNQCMLKDYEWELLEGLVKVLKPFDEMTTYFSGIQYVTLSIVNPAIELLKFEFADGELDEFTENNFFIL